MTTPFLIDGPLLDRATATGVISAEQAERLKALALESQMAVEEPDDERLRFVSGFNDVFVTIGIGLFLVALRLLMGNVALSYGAIAIASWLLAEYFTRKRRMALPSIVLVGAFAGSLFVSSIFFLSDQPDIDASGPLVLAAAAALTLVLTAAHYWRFRVPVTVAAGAAAAGGMLLALLASSVPDLSPDVYQAILVALGVAVFAAAMMFDLRDPQRLTLNTDIAFWLHLLAAPLIVHPLVSGIAGQDGATGMTPEAALAVLAIFLMLGLVALVIDRRAMLVSGLVYAGIAFARLMGLSDGLSWPLTMLMLGIFVLGLSAGWRPLRRALLGLLPARVSARLPHPLTSG